MTKHRALFRTVAMLLVLLTVFSLTPKASALYDNTWVNTGNLRDDIVGVAMTQVGYLETGFNDNKFGSSFGVNNQAWCALFVWWCCLKAEVPNLPMTASCTGLRNGFISNGCTWHSVDSGYAPRKGDIVFYTTTLTDGIGHSGIVREDSPAEGPIHTIEGNTTNPNGYTADGVFAKDRPLRGDVVSVYGYISLTEVPATGSVTVAEEAAEELTVEVEIEEEVTVTVEETEETVEEEPIDEPEDEPAEEPIDEPEDAPLRHGWALEDGRWHYYDDDGVMMRDDWAPTTYGWRRLDEEGELDETQWADHDFVIYYV